MAKNIARLTILFIGIRYCLAEPEFTAGIRYSTGPITLERGGKSKIAEKKERFKHQDIVSTGKVRSARIEFRCYSEL